MTLNEFDLPRLAMIRIRVMTMEDYDAVLALMNATPGISIRDADARDATARYLARNPGMSFVAESEAGLCGCVMCGHDGRRGYLQHLLVLPAHRRQGIARSLVQHCLASLEAVGIEKCHLDVLTTNDTAARYWQHEGWQKRDDIVRYSFTRPGRENA